MEMNKDTLDKIIKLDARTKNFRHDLNAILIEWTKKLNSNKSDN